MYSPQVCVGISAWTEHELMESLADRYKDGRGGGGVGSPRSACILLNHCTAWACLQRCWEERKEGGKRGRRKEKVCIGPAGEPVKQLDKGQRGRKKKKRQKT